MKLFYVIFTSTVVFAALVSIAFLSPYPSSWNDRNFIDFATFLATSTAPFTIIFTLFIAFKDIEHRKAQQIIQDLDSAIQDTAKRIETILDKEHVVKIRRG